MLWQKRSKTKKLVLTSLNQFSCWLPIFRAKNRIGPDPQTLIVMLPDKMFVNLIDMDLQNWIAIANDLDSDAAQALKLLLEEAPTEMTTGLQDWTLETTEGQNILFYKGKNYIPKDIDLHQDIVKTFHDHETAGHC